MKKLTTIALVLIVTLGGCEKIKNLAEVNIKTHFIVSVPVNNSLHKAISVEESLLDVDFSGTATLNLQTNEEISEYMNKLRNIDFESLLITVEGLDAEQEIISASISIANIGTICSVKNITASNNTVQPEVDRDKLKKAGKKLMDDGQITINISGTSSKPIQATGLRFKLDFKSVVTAGALD